MDEDEYYTYDEDHGQQEADSMRMSSLGSPSGNSSSRARDVNGSPSGKSAASNLDASNRRDRAPQNAATPVITDLAQMLFASPREPIEVRSQLILEERERRLKKLAMVLEEKNQKELTFKPDLSQSKIAVKHDSIVSSSQAEIEKRKARLEELKKKRMAVNTFSPEISTYSKSLLRDEPVHDRLYRLSEAPRSSPPEFGSEDYDPETGQQLFQPRINEAFGLRDERVDESLYRDAENRRLRKLMLQENIRQIEESTRSQRKITDRSLELARRKREKELRGVFDAVDKNSTGVLKSDQIDETMARLGFFKEAAPEKRTEEEFKLREKVWKVLDPASSGSVDFATYFRVLSAVLDPSTPEYDDEAVEASPMKKLTKDLRKLFVNRLAYTKIGNTEGVEEQLRRECTFSPNINPNSRQLEKVFSSSLSSSLDASSSPSPSPSAASSKPLLSSPAFQPRPSSASSSKGSNAPSGGQTPRYLMLYDKARKTEEKLKAERNRHKDDDIKDCTFAPKTNKSATVQPRKDPFSALYDKRNKKPASAPEIPSWEQKEIDQCTFRPNREPTKNVKVDSLAKNVPKGYEAAIERLRHAGQEREQHDKNQFYSMLRSGGSAVQPSALGNTSPVAASGKNAKSGPTEPKPFSFMLDKRRRKNPLLFMDINLGPGRTGRIGIHEGDDPKVLARNFAASYRLDDSLAQRLEELLRQHMETILSNGGQQQQQEDGQSPQYEGEQELVEGEEGDYSEQQQQQDYDGSYPDDEAAYNQMMMTSSSSSDLYQSALLGSAPGQESAPGNMSLQQQAMFAQAMSEHNL